MNSGRYLCLNSREFNKAIVISPSIIAMKQNPLCINAAKKVFPISFIGPDEWHVDQNRNENYTSGCSRIWEK